MITSVLDSTVLLHRGEVKKPLPKNHPTYGNDGDSRRNMIPSGHGRDKSYENMASIPPGGNLKCGKHRQTITSTSFVQKSSKET